MSKTLYYYNYIRVMDKQRCWRCLKDKLYIDYHDNERGKPVHDDNKHFEYLLLETFQAGLSRYTILVKRENFRKAFNNFDYLKIAQYDNIKVEELLVNSVIIRHRGKIEAAVRNAQIFIDIQKKYWSRDNFIRNYTDWKIINNNITDYKIATSQTELAKKISNDLKKMGMKFIWPTVMYAHLQATGQVNDHEVSCWKHKN